MACSCKLDLAVTGEFVDNHQGNPFLPSLARKKCPTTITKIVNLPGAPVEFPLSATWRPEAASRRETKLIKI